MSFRKNDNMQNLVRNEQNIRKFELKKIQNNKKLISNALRKLNISLNRQMNLK